MKATRTINRPWIALSGLYIGLIFFASSRPYLHAPGPDFDMKDKVFHAAEYFVLAALVSRAARRPRAAGWLVSVLVVVAVGATVAAADELFQGTVPGRMRDVTDWAADVTGLAAGAALATPRRRAAGENAEG